MGIFPSTVHTIYSYATSYLFLDEESTKFSRNRPLLTFIFVVVEVCVLLDKSNKALTLLGHFHLTHSLATLVRVHKFKCPTRLRVLLHRLCTASFFIVIDEMNNIHVK